jgi:CheY-like chemotaxis protein
VKNHDGIIYVSNELGKGAIFDVYLPSMKGDAEMEIAGEGTIPGGHEHILYADDDKVLLELARMILESLGYKVTAGTSSVEVLRMFVANPAQFDLVITDMTMPVMPGSELAREIMKIRPDIPVILCTGFSEYIDEAKAKELGIKAFIMKPFAKKDLGRIVRDVLDGRV